MKEQTVCTIYKTKQNKTKQTNKQTSDNKKTNRKKN